MMTRAFRAPTLTLCFLLVTVTGFAQSPSPEPAPSEKRSTLTVLLSSDAIYTIVRAAGYFPLTEPQKKGTMYMLRVLDHRDVQMRVVVDARSGAITAVNRIVFQRPARCRSLRDRDYASRRPNYTVSLETGPIALA